jgi:UDP-3-O-[3-hydroxymyristoyl] glucosamine N-acyltransferase
VPEYTLSGLCEAINEAGLSARLDGEDRSVKAVNTIEGAGQGEITFLANPKYLSTMAETKASAVIVDEKVEVPAPLSAVRCDDPYAAVTVAIIYIHGHRRHPQWGISDKATIHPTAKIGPGANIAEYVSIAADVTIGENCTIYPGCYVGERAKLGHDCVLFPNVVVYDQCELGDRVTIHAGSVVGQDGLGYAPIEDGWLKIPQVGRAVLGDDVEIGANCAVDRATLGETRIASGTKFGNVVVIGHGTKVGEDCLFVGLVGVAGSATIERHVTLAGQVGVVGHVTVGHDVRVGAQSGVHGNIRPGSEVLGSPARPIRSVQRAAAAVQKLPETIKRIKELEKEVERLKERLDER